MTATGKKKKADNPVTDASSFLSELRKKQLEFWSARVQSSSFRADLSKIVDNGRNWALEQKISRLVSAKKVQSFVERIRKRNVPDNQGLFIAFQEGLRGEIKRLGSSPQKLDEFLSGASLDALETMLEYPNIIPRAWIEKSFDHEAFQQLMASLLYNALKEFTIQVNPFFSSWGLPALLKKASPFGSIDPFGLGNKVVETIRIEYEKQLEPQIKNFLKLFTGKALQHALMFIIDSGNRNIFIKFRTDILRNFSQERISDLCEDFDDELNTRFSDVLVLVAIDFWVHETTFEVVSEHIDEFYARYGQMRAGDFFEEFGIDMFDWSHEILDFLWPIMQKYFKSNDFNVALELVINEFYDHMEEQMELK